MSGGNGILAIGTQSVTLLSLCMLRRVTVRESDVDPSVKLARTSSAENNCERFHIAKVL